MGSMNNLLNSYNIFSILISFIIVSILAPIVIPMLTRLKFGQNIRKDGPKSHQKKAGTPTMGGIIFIIATLISMIIMVGKPSDEAMVALYAFIAYGFIGFLDDLLKIIRKDNLGLRARQKMVLLLIVSSILSYYAYTKVGTEVFIPFTNKTIDFGILYIPFMLFYFSGATNAVNLTDGLDGLATSVTLLVITFFALVSFGMGHYTLSIFCLIVAGALLGFLRFNAFPARVFMGDTGSLALGGAVATVAMVLKLQILLGIVGGIYVAETLSVIIQVTSFKLTGKRVFKMSPLHHHFEQIGWPETKIVSSFSIITVLLCLIAFLAF
ncbi:phospho-N-acetylmuramoyl-pentapeptide-transferase [Clostridium sp. MSJ-4]|uniref:Phospho-N-acetylmuramoyl-pentapeptide-transferase n=2 Tax=Clostridiaceae TaxID=31979 RepID=A0ABS6EYI6_9CLOT|nr:MULTISPECIES: phospho-N-acetylmuramoyl-pentapeptide-transferase [Clostridium]MBU5590795.1 phospho-N-acetylmuramoyl-pentapeptide-transferase [Clostridium simiarum]